MSYSTEILTSMKPEKEFFIGIDSDGCVFDSMEIKHKECFCPQFINHFGLQPVSKYAREIWEFVNLYSKTRGCNRFLAVVNAFNLINRHPLVQARGKKAPDMPGFRAWVERENKLGNYTLIPEVEKTGDKDLKLCLDWSLDVNDAVVKIVRDVPPFPLVRDSLSAMVEKADTCVVSQTPTETLIGEWETYGIYDFVRAIAGQELGTKTQHLAMVAKGKYPSDKILMIGDAPGDHKAAVGNDALFYPINPGDEEASWDRFKNEALGKFFNGTYAGTYEQHLLDEFNKYLPEKMSWEKA